MLFKRLYRRIKWLLFYQWRTLKLKQWPYESCKKCGKAFRVLWSVKDDVWQEVLGISDSGGGSLCIDCFAEIADSKSIYLHDNDFDCFELFIIPNKENQ